MAGREKRDINKDDNVAFELNICNVELTNRILGTGSFASVIEASWYGTPCAAKQVHSKFLESSHSEDFISSFNHESVTWGKLKHPHIVLLLGLFQTETSTLPLLVMERMDTSLTTLLEDCKAGDKQLSLQQKVSILLQVSLGLAYLHQRDSPAVHGDLSANNVLITLATLTAKISDFGIARSLQFVSQKAFTNASHLYLPPEVLESASQQSLTSEVDTFSYGVLIIHVVNLQLLRLRPPRIKHPSKKGLLSLTEFERRKEDLDLFPEKERSLFMDLIEKCLEFESEDRPNSLALVSNLQEIQSEVRPPQSDDVMVVSKSSNEVYSDGHSIQSPTGLDETELQILEKSLQLEKYIGEVEAREEKSKQNGELLEEMNMAIQDNRQKISVNERQFKKALKFNDLKWERPHTLTHGIRYSSYISSHLSCNAVEYNGEIFIGYLNPDAGIYKITADPKKVSGYSRFSKAECIARTQSDGSLQNYALVVCQGLLHMLGGEYVRNNKPTGKYSRKIITGAKKTVYQYQWNECYPPMKTASASPAVVIYKEHIVVVHKSGPVEVLNTNSPNPVWTEIHPAPYIPKTPSATLLGDRLVIWSGTLYYTDLRNVLTDDTEDANATADWTTLPSPPITSSSTHLTTLNEQLIAIDVGNTSGSRPLYAFNSASGKWSHIHNQCPGDVTVCVDSKALLTFQETVKQVCVYEGVLA